MSHFVWVALAAANLWLGVAIAPARGDAESPAPRATAERSWQLRTLGAESWHAAGYRGQGVKVAILDSGFRGYRDSLGKGLPGHVTVRSFRNDGNLEAKDSRHGILCGEVVHALAPEAELLFANWEPDSPQRFLEAVRWARESGARVVSCSVISPGWSDGEGGGPVHALLSAVLGDGLHAGDLVCAASAGNTARRHWFGPFSPDADGFHRWSGPDARNHLTSYGAERVSVELSWKGEAAYEVTVADSASGAVVARSRPRGEAGVGSAVARFRPRPGHDYHARVRLLRGPAAPFHCIALGANLGYATAPGSVCFPADGPRVVAVGAVDADSRRMSYSSCGPNSAEPKPDLVAPVPFQCAGRGHAFGGTSAAAPQVAAAAALWWSRHPEWTAERVRAALRTSARDLGTPGHDCETGYGLLHLPESVTRTAKAN